MNDLVDSPNHEGLQPITKHGWYFVALPRNTKQWQAPWYTVAAKDGEPAPVLDRILYNAETKKFLLANLSSWTINKVGPGTYPQFDTAEAIAAYVIMVEGNDGR